MKTIKNILTLLSILFIFSCDDRVEEIGPESILMWIDGEVWDVDEEYERITTYGSRDTYVDTAGEQKTRKIFLLNRYLIQEFLKLQFL